MPTITQKLLNKWIERNYKSLCRTMPQKDMLHSAYITVYHFRRPFVPTAERFSDLMEQAYHRHILAELNHAMHYPLADPIFWILRGEELADEERTVNGAEDNNSHQLSDLSSSGLTKVFSFVKKNFPQEVFSIFKMAVVEQRSVAEIASISGLSKKDVHVILDGIEKSIRKGFKPSTSKKNKQN